jgi:hypothetical protein
MEQLAQSFSKLLARRLGREPGSTLAGAVNFRVVDKGGATLEFSHRYQDTSLSWSLGHAAEAFASIELPADVLAGLVRGGIFDWRFTANVRIQAQDPFSLYYVSMLMSEPPAAVKTVFEEAERSSPEALNEVTELVPRRPDDWQPGRGPALLSGVMQDWPTSAWTPEYLRERHGQLRLGPHPLARLFPPPGAPGPYAPGEALPPELLDHRVVLENTLVRGLPSPSVLLLDAPRVFGGASVERPICHRDPADAYLFHVFGDKEFLVFPACVSQRLYGLQAYARHQPSWVDWFAPDCDRFPGAREVYPYRARLEPGQVLYIPRGWFHAARASGPTLSISLFKARPGETN